MAKRKEKTVADLRAPAVDPTQTDGGDTDAAVFVAQFNESADNTSNARRFAELYRDYYDGKQWTEAEKTALQSRGQPCITDNRIKDKVEYLLGLERQTRTDPKAYPRTPQDDPGADAATDALRYVADCNHFPQVKSRVFENMVVEGFGGCEVIVEDEAAYNARGAKGNRKVRQRYIRWDRLYYDSHSLAEDFSDARFVGIVRWMDVAEAKTTYPKYAETFDEVMGGASLGWGSFTYDDKPRWFDRQRRRVQILEHYFKQGSEWMRVVFGRAGIIEPPAKVVYIDSETGKPECPLLLQSLYVDRDGARYGVVKRYKDLQDEINKRRSKSLHLLSVNQGLSETGAVGDVNLARKEAARPDGWIEYAPGMKLEIRNNADLAEGQFKLLADAQAALSGTGPNEALLGNTGDLSGRAKQLDQAGGAIQLGILTDSLRYWQTRVMRASWNRIRQFWTAEQWVRVTDDENSRFMVLNAPDPKTGKQVNVSELDLDIIIDESPDVITIQQEQFQTLAELAKSGMPIPPDVLIQASGLRNKQKIIDRMQNKLPDGTDIPPQVAQMIQEKEQQIQQITQAQGEKAQEQQQAQSELDAQQMKMDGFKSQLQGMQTKIDAQQAIAQAQQAARDAEQQAAQESLKAQMEIISAQLIKLAAKETEVKAIELVAGANIEAAQAAADLIAANNSNANTIDTLTAKLAQQEAQHKAAFAQQEHKHTQALMVQPNEPVVEKQAKATKPRQIAIMRDAGGRISGATIN